MPAGILGINPVTGTESPRAGDFVSTMQWPGTYSTDQILLAPVNDGATSYIAGTVLGKQVVGSKATFANNAGDTGNGTCGTITLSAGVLPGVYTFTCLVAGATAKFEALAPNGAELAILTVGSAYSGGGLGFTITTGGTNYAVGDVFTITVGNAAFANTAGDTGNGTCSAIVVGPGVIGGVYTFTATSATNFTGVDPFGNVLPNLTVGSAYYGGGLTFTITAGGTAYVAGDSFTITTYTGNDEWYPWNPSAFDGTQVAAGILWQQTYVGGSTAVKVSAVVRDCEVKDALLAWPSTITDDQQRAAYLQLAGSYNVPGYPGLGGIIVRNALV